jgi:hypothetical protein
LCPLAIAIRGHPEAEHPVVPRIVNRCAGAGGRLASGFRRRETHVEVSSRVRPDRVLDEAELEHADEARADFVGRRGRRQRERQFPVLVRERAFAGVRERPRPRIRLRGLSFDEHFERRRLAVRHVFDERHGGLERRIAAVAGQKHSNRLCGGREGCWHLRTGAARHKT